LLLKVFFFVRAEESAQSKSNKDILFCIFFFFSMESKMSGTILSKKNLLFQKTLKSTDV